MKRVGHDTLPGKERVVYTARSPEANEIKFSAAAMQELEPNMNMSKNIVNKIPWGGTPTPPHEVESCTTLFSSTLPCLSTRCWEIALLKPQLPVVSLPA